MSDSDRRQFLKQTAAAAAGAGVLAPWCMVAADQAAADKAAPFPPHQPLVLPGLHAYAEKSVAAGQSVYFRISSAVPYRLAVCRLAGAVDDPSSDIVLHKCEAAPSINNPFIPVRMSTSKKRCRQRSSGR